MSGPSHKGFEFGIKRIFGLPIVVCRYAVPSCYGGPGSWEWSRWKIASFGNQNYAAEKLQELNRR